MVSLIPEVHLFVCLDSRISSGAILHCLDIARAQDWQQETVLLCDEAWRPFVNIDQPIIFIDRASFFGNGSDSVSSINVENLEQLLEQLDAFEISKVTQIGELSWGRWLDTYFEQESKVEIQKINWSESSVTSLQVLNDVAQELALDISVPTTSAAKSSVIYVDPYKGGELSSNFLSLVNGIKKSQIPDWLNVIAQEKDFKQLSELGLEGCLVDVSETAMSLFNQSVLCFSDESQFALTSRSYNIALYQCKSEQSLFVPGDIVIKSNSEMHISELFNILTYWKTKRLKELAFQWLNMGIDIEHVETFHSRIVKRNLLNYSSDLFHSQILVKNFVESDRSFKQSEVMDMIYFMRKEIDNDPYSLSFSLKILVMIVERMLASASCGERLFQRLGSDYHRIIIGEALIEGLIDKNSKNINELNLKKKLQTFLSYLVQIDHCNDQADIYMKNKES